MHIPKSFEQTDIDAMRELILANPLGTFVTALPDGLTADHIPFELMPGPEPCGALLGHVARANPVWRDISPGAEALVIFNAAQAYISPSWYPTKPVTEKVVPTWNYVVVHAYGRVNVVEEADWLAAHIERLVDRHEARFERPWSVSDAPDEYIDKMLRAIVGIEIDISRLQGKWKVSQNRPREDRAGVVRGLRSSGTPGALQMADYVETTATR